jgi:hypothetical protein
MAIRIPSLTPQSPEREPVLHLRCHSGNFTQSRPLDNGLIARCFRDSGGIPAARPEGRSSKLLTAIEIWRADEACLV